MKEDTVRNVGFVRFAIFCPSIIVGNAHTQAWVAGLGCLVPRSVSAIDQSVLGRSIAVEIALRGEEAGEVTLDSAAMKNSLRSSKPCFRKCCAEPSDVIGSFNHRIANLLAVRRRSDRTAFLMHTQGFAIDFDEVKRSWAIM